MLAAHASVTGTQQLLLHQVVYDEYAIRSPMPSPVPGSKLSGSGGSCSVICWCHFFSAYRHQSRGCPVLSLLYVDLVKETSAGRAAGAGQGKAPRVSDRLPLERGEGARQGRREVRFLHCAGVDGWVTCWGSTTVGSYVCNLR